MVYETINAIQNSDSVKAAAEQSEQVFQEITFNPDMILSGDGIFISVVGYIIVFLALVMLYLVFSNLAKVLNRNLRKKLRAKGVETTDEDDLTIPGEVGAAISTALHLHFAEVHDFENTVLTIQKVQKPYSPWSSKLYGLRQTPSKR